VLAWAALVTTFLVMLAVLVLYLPTLSAAALLGGFLSLILSVVVVRRLPTWASLSIVGAIIAAVVIGGEALLVKTLLIGGIVLLARWLWRRYIPL